MYRPSHPPYEEERLVAGCLRGEDTAWETMFDVYHPKLVSIINAILHGESGAEEAEEIAAVVWSSLCSEAFTRLREYDPHTGRLLGYLASIARREIWRERRSNRHRHFRESKAARAEATVDELGRRLDIQEFLATLTPREKEFFLSDLVRQSAHSVPSGLSPTREWQLRSRIMKKFRMHFFPDS